ncbi:universal bacterial protein YeaZ [Alistipes sp. CAG:831]|nr:universal bacterial protein YeaZ [Alistipes sp. CAG:831]
MQISGLAAVAVSSGPGSYTGLRVGVSTAKGICFGAGIPLIGIETLTAIACGTLKTGAAQEDPDGTVIIPMIDARRMEVYTALYDSSAQRISETEAVVLTPDTFSGTLKKYRRVIFTGDGAAKYENMLPEQYKDRCIFLPSRPEAADMAAAAFRALKEKKFEDTAYFEPFYLKEFIAADPSRKIEAVLHPERKL